MTTQTWFQRLDEVLTAPNARAGERALAYGAATAGAVFAGTFALASGVDVWISTVLAVFGFDLFGGVVVNASASGSRRFHAPSASRWGAVGFVACHVHLPVLALLMPEMPWMTAVVGYLGILGSTVLVTITRTTLRTPVAFLCAAALIATTTTLLLPAPVVAWMAPLLVVKLLLAHLLPHAPSTDR